MKYEKIISENELNNALNIYINFPERSMENLYIITEYIIDSLLGNREKASIPESQIQSKIYTLIKQYALEQLSNEEFLDVSFGEKMPIYSITEKGINKQKEIIKNYTKTNIPPSFKNIILIERKNDKI